MARVRSHLPNAPIKEGLIDFRVVKRADLELSALELLVARLEPDYLKKGPIVELEANLSVSAEGEGSAKTSSRALGIRFHSRDEKYVAQFQLEGFTLSRLAPYETWDKLLAEAQRLWVLYVQCVAPGNVRRVATRFINNLQLPMQQGEEFESFLAAPPKIPRALPQRMAAFLQRVVIHDAESDILANLAQVLQPGVSTERVPVILDIDVYCLTDLVPSSDELWTRLEQLRAFKNRAFFESLTERAVELYL